MRKSLFKTAKVFPWITNVTLYGCLFAGGDFVHQYIAHRDEIDWRHTRNVALVASSFQGNFNYFWLRALERRFPGRSLGMISRKLLLDQSFASPLATSVFYTGVSFLEGKEDVFEDWREKFFNTYKVGCMDEWIKEEVILQQLDYTLSDPCGTGCTTSTWNANNWTYVLAIHAGPFLFSQFWNFMLMPPYLRAVFMGCSAFIWATFLCLTQQSGDGTVAVALERIMARPPDEALGQREVKTGQCK
ncbi:hypothetical protein P4O66_007824 [Electrophorus voltai]|uniref:Uncharacterized protein n=1 Tax=Electrophorus voltai TaxID=2609070 RepID=A0AAD8ZF54_9TELE|nr:hypothetical protein P4O66_007824 [Electrophorus voltai]